jgi:predicted nucleic acid-binding protein
MICFDTMLLIWGVQGTATPNRIRMIDLTKRYIDSLIAEETIMVPAVAAAEYLAGFRDEAQRIVEWEAINRRFFIPAFDSPAVALAATLAQTSAAIALLTEGQRRCIKADIQIIATAIAHGAKRIVTGNVSEYRKLAGDRIEVVDVPVLLF